MSRSDAPPSPVRLLLPGQLRPLAGGLGELTVAGAAGTVAALFERLRAEHPAVYDRIVTERREIRPHVNVFVNGDDIRWSGGPETPVASGSEVVILPAVSGG